MQTTLIRQAAAALNALRRHFSPRAAAPAATTDGHDAHWRIQQFERGERERALYQLRVLGWPGA